MIKVTEIGNHSDGKVLYLNPDCIESYDPRESEIRLKDGRVLIVDPSTSDVHLLMEGYHHYEKAELDYLRQAVDNLVMIVNGEAKDKAVITSYSMGVPDETLEKAQFVIDEVLKKYSECDKVDSDSDKKGKKG